MDVFDKYAPFIQEYIFRNKWESLRGVQVAAAEVIFNTDQNLLLSASTASGKTEAAFFPILTLFHQDPPSSVGAIYIGPLKALINDQFSRLEELCQEENIPVWHWHGDVAQSHKNRLLKNPSGILQITPESLEAMLMHKHSMIPTLFSDLRFIVIDEIHSLLRGDRGGQTLCLIQRLCKAAGVNPRRIGLSATLGDPEKAGEYLSKGTDRITLIPHIQGPKNKWRISMAHFYVGSDEGEENNQKELDKADGGFEYIYRHTKNKKSLIFVNSREECETVTTSLRQYCELQNEEDRFMIHHGNLSSAIRETAEGIMKDPEKNFTTVTTATLELGIDIGRLERAFQIDSPAMVSSFLQRMGRTGRRGQPQEMWFVIREDEAEPRTLMPATIPWKLLQAIAIVQLYLEEKWVEPQRLDRLPYSLLYHQTLSTLASEGELSPPALASKVLTLPPFHKVSREDYKILLQHLIKTDQLQKTETGGLIIGLAGEKQIMSYKFYAVFQENEEFTVRCSSQELGTVVKPPPVGERLAIAGHVWVVEEIDIKRHLVYVEMIKGNIPAYFGQCPGDIHTKVLGKIKSVLDSRDIYPYLMDNARTRLTLGRNVASTAKITQTPLINLGGDAWCLIPWLGTYSFLALERFLKLICAKDLGLSGFDSARPFYMQFKMTATEKEFWEIIKKQASKDIDPYSLLYKNELPLFEKYDEFLPEELVRKSFTHSVLDIKECKERMLEFASTF